MSRLFTNVSNANTESRVWHITGHSVNVFAMNLVDGQKKLVLILVVMTAVSIYLAPTVCQAFT